MSEDVKLTAPSSIDDLKPAQALSGKVKHLELYGAFVDIGLKQDGLLHISQLGQTVRNVEDVVNVGDQVTVYVLKIDKEAGRVALTLVEPPAVSSDDLQEGSMLTGKVVRIENYGVFVDVGAERPGMVHVSELADGYVKSPSDVVKIGQEVNVRVLKVTRKKKQIQIDLTMKERMDHAVEIIDEPEEENAPTAMAMALRKAMKTARDEEPEDFFVEEESDFDFRPSRKRDKRDKRRYRDQQDEIVSRTLRNHSN